MSNTIILSGLEGVFWPAIWPVKWPVHVDLDVSPSRQPQCDVVPPGESGQLAAHWQRSAPRTNGQRKAASSCAMRRPERGASGAIDSHLKRPYWWRRCKRRDLCDVDILVRRRKVFRERSDRTNWQM